MRSLRALVLVTTAFVASPASAQFGTGFPPVSAMRIQSAGTTLATRPFLNCTGQLSCSIGSSTQITATVAAGAGGTLQNAYDNSAGASPSILLTAANNEIQIRAPAAAMGTIFDVQTNAGGGILRISDNAASSFVSIGALTLTGAAASTWSTSTGALTVDSAAALNLGTTNATSLAIGRAGVSTTITSGAAPIDIIANANGVFLRTSATHQITNSAAAAQISLEWDSSTLVENGSGTTITGALTQLTGAVSLTGNAASSFTTSAGALTLTGAAASTWSTSAGSLTITSGAALNLNASATGAIVLGGTGTGLTVGNDTFASTFINQIRLNAQNAGAGANTNQIVPSVHNSGTVNQAIEYGTNALSAGSVTITFSPAFNATPSCVCTDAAASVQTCSVDTATAISSTQVKFLGNGTDNVHWICIGAR